MTLIITANKNLIENKYPEMYEDHKSWGILRVILVNKEGGGGGKLPKSL